MDRSPASLQLGGRATAWDRACAPTSFDPSIAGLHGGQSVKSAHAKEYGSAFAEGFLRFLRTGDLADVVVEVVTDDTALENDVATGAPTTAALKTTPQGPTSISTSASSRSPPSASHSLSPAAHDSNPPSAATAASTSLALAAPSPTSPPSSAAVTPSSAIANPLGEFRLHSLLLARHSAFFAAALGQEHFADSAARRIRLTLDPAAAPAWPTLVEFFYTDRVHLDDSNALPLLALARQLLVPELDSYCNDYVCGRLCAANCLNHLRAAVRFALHDLHLECVALAAQAFPLLYRDDLGGLPPTSLLEVLAHPLLQVHCELQVVEAVTRYLTATAVDSEAQRALCAQIRFPYLDNATITRLAVHPSAVLAAAAGATHGAAGTAATDGSSGETADTVAPKTTSVSTGLADVKLEPPADRPSPSPSGGASEHAGGAAHGSVAAAATGEPADAADGSGGAAAAIEAASAVEVDGMPDAAAAAGQSDRSASDGSAVIAEEDTAEAADDGLISANSSACSSPRSSSGGGTALPPGALHSRTHNRLEVRARGDAQQAQQQQQPSCLAPVPLPLLPREMVLEGALARLAAMEFGGFVPPASAAPALELTHGAAASWALGGAASPGPQPNHPYIHPYQPYQFQYQYGTGAAAALGGGAAAGQHAAVAAAAANGGRRPLAVFPVHGAVQAQPAAAAAAVALPSGGGVGGGGPHALAHGLFYNQHAIPAGGPPPPPPPPHPQQHPAHPAALAARDFLYGSRDGTEPGPPHAAGGTAAILQRGAEAACGAVAAFFLPAPRPSYCCNLVHGLPGGCAWVDVALEAMWEHLVPYIAVQVSGCAEGSPLHVLSCDPDCFFETNDSMDPLPWVEVQLPHNVHVLQLHRYTFLHGHRRAGYYRARNFKTQVAVRPASEARVTGSASGAAARRLGPAAGHSPAGTSSAVAAAAAAVGTPPTCRYVDLTTRMAEQFDVGVLSGTTAVGPWRVMRLQATGAQEDGVHRLCVRGLRMYGIARVDLMHQSHGGFVVQPHWVLNARLDQGASAGGAPAGTGGGGGGGSPYGGSVVQHWLGLNHGH